MAKLDKKAFHKKASLNAIEEFGHAAITNYGIMAANGSQRAAKKAKKKALRIIRALEYVSTEWGHC
jgi:hypothetical protein